MKHSRSLGLKTPSAIQQGLSYEVPFTSHQTLMRERTSPAEQEATVSVLTSRFVRCGEI